MSFQNFRSHHRHVKDLSGLQVQWWSYFLSNATSRCRASQVTFQWPSPSHSCGTGVFGWMLPLVLHWFPNNLWLIFRKHMTKADEMRVPQWLFVFKLQGVWTWWKKIVSFKRMPSSTALSFAEVGPEQVKGVVISEVYIYRPADDKKKRIKSASVYRSCKLTWRVAGKSTILMGIYQERCGFSRANC